MPAAWAWLNQLLHKASDLLGVGYQLMPFSELKAQLLNVATQYIGLGQAGSVVGFIAHSGAGVISAVGMAVLTVVMTCYLLLDWERFVAQLFKVVPLPWQGEVASVSAQCHQVVGAFMRGQLMVMLLLSIFYAVCLQVMGLKVGFLIGVLTGVLAIVPYLGALVSVALALVAVLLQFGFAWLPLSLLVIIYMVGHVLEGYVLQPLLLGDKIGLSPVAVVMAVLIGGHLAGIVGMFIALPLAAVLVVIIKHLYQHYQHSHFYTGK
jgi:predicted PurR-regulated permease PerM